jgi:hypothetical protein
MDVSALAMQLVTYLAPFLPYLVKAGDKAVEEAGKLFGASAWERAKSLWAKLTPKIEAKPAAKEAVQDAANAPEDEDAKAAWRLQVKKLLSEDPVLASDLAKVLADLPSGSTNVTITGDRSVGIGRDALDSMIITGDKNAVKSRRRRE